LTPESVAAVLAEVAPRRQRGVGLRQRLVGLLDVLLDAREFTSDGDIAPAPDNHGHGARGGSGKPIGDAASGAPPHLPAPPTPSQQPLGTPVYRTAAFAFGTAEEYRAVLNDEMPGYTYSRIDNPTVDAFARAVAALEGVNLPRWPAAQAFASGMAAISGVFWTFARTGAHVIASAAVYGGTYGFLRNVAARFGVETDFVDITDLEQVRAAVRPTKRIIYAETIANPTTAVADVRSNPYSRRLPQFNREALERELKRNRIAYLYFGDQLGGRPRDPDVYDADGRVDYERVRQTAEFRFGLVQLLRGLEKHTIAMLCGEDDPLDCHRGLMIAPALAERGLPLAHLHKDGTVEAQADLNVREGDVLYASFKATSVTISAL